MRIQVKPRVRFSPSRRVLEASRNFSNLQKTQYDPDKVEFGHFSLVENMVHEKLNADVRGGTTNLITIAAILGIGMYENSTANKLMAAVDTGSTSKLVEIDRSAGTSSDKITGITGDGTPSFTSLEDVFYMANNSSDLVEWDGSSNYTVATPSGKPRLITNDEGRIWAVANNLLYFSQKPSSGRITSFAISGTGLERAGIATSAITKFEAVTHAGKIVIAIGNGIVEGHKLPEASDGLTTFPSNLSTLKWTAEEISASGANCAWAVGNFIYIKGDNGFVYEITATSGKVKIIAEDEGTLEKYTFDAPAVGYDQRENILYFSGKSSGATVNNTCFAYDLRAKNFATYPNLLPNQFVGDKDDVYYLQSVGNVVVDAFDRDVTTDNGREINWKARTAISYAGSQEFLKDSDRVFLSCRVWEDIDVLYKFITDRGIDSKSNVVAWQKTYSFDAAGAAIDGLIGGVDTGIWGGAGFAYTGVDTTVEALKNEDVIDSDLFHRAQLEISGASKKKFSLRGVGFYAIITSKPVYDQTYG